MAGNAVIIRGEEFLIRKEGVCTVAVTPGMLVSGRGVAVKPHDAAGANANKAFALPNDLVGEDIDDDYTIGDTVQIGLCRAGMEVNAILATSQVIVAEDPLESAGDGYLQKHDPTVDVSSTTAEIYEQSIVAYATEAVTTTSAVARIKVEVA